MPPPNFASADASVDQLVELRRIRGSLGHAGAAFTSRYNVLTSKRWNNTASGAPSSAGGVGGEQITAIVSATPFPNSEGGALTAIAGSVSGNGINAASDAAVGTAVEVMSKAADLGFNPVDIVIMTLNQIQTSLGIPYWEAIVIFTVALRLCLLPVAIKGVVNANRMAFLRPDMERLQEAMKASQALGDMKVQQRYQMEMKGLFEKHKVNPLRALVLPFLQMPIFVSVFMALRQVQDYFPAYCSGGALWFIDLSMSDPYYILPVINAATFLLMIETGADGMDQQMKGTFKNVMRMLGVAMVPLTASMPQGLFMYWCTNNVLSLLQARAMKSAALKKAFDLKDPPASAKVDKESALKKISAVGFPAFYIVSTLYFICEHTNANYLYKSTSSEYDRLWRNSASR
jgi:YidC/Oxa1 family membrane protein insertase